MVARSVSEAVDRHVLSTKYPLLHKHTIRLLRILPADGTGSIRCVSNVFSLDSSKRYTALSYAWGASSEDNSCAIRLNGEPHRVTKNLLRFLIEFQRLPPEDSELLWVDALCINQEDNEEKMQQVRGMDGIFSRAVKVLAWIGPSYDQSARAMRLITEPLSHWRKKRKLLRVWTTTDGTALRSLFTRNYWRRLWIFQELVLARKIVIMCGRQSLPWDAFRDLLHEISLCQPPKHIREGFEYETVQASVAMALVKQIKNKSKEATVLEAMIATQQLRCSEPRDKVYALLSVANQGGSSIVPDYTISMTKLLNEVLKHHHYVRPPSSLEEVSDQCRELCMMAGVSPRSLFAPDDNDTIEESQKASMQIYHLGREQDPITLWWASRWGHEAVARVLLDSKVIDAPGLLERLAVEGNVDVLRLMVRFDWIDLDTKGTEGGTPLFWAATKAHRAVVELLLASGRVDADAVNDEQWSSLCQAADFGHDAIVKLLLDSNQVDVDRRDKTGRTPVSWAAQSGRHGAIELLVATGKVDVDSADRSRRTPLSFAAEKGHLAVVELLLQADGISVDSPDASGLTPFAWAVQNGHEDVVKLLISTGMVSLDSMDGWGRTPLSRAVEHGHEKICKILLETGAVNVRTKDVQGLTTYHWSAKLGNAAICELLLNASHDGIDARDMWRMTPLSYGAWNGRTDLVRLLLDTGLVDVDAVDEEGGTPLSRAMDYGSEDIVRMLLATGHVDLQRRDNKGWTPFHWCVPQEHGGTAAHTAIVRMLIDTGEVDVNCEDSRGRTPLSWAAQYGCMDIAAMLLETGQVDVSHPDDTGSPPIAWAARNSHAEMVQLLRSYERARAAQTR